MKFQLWKEKKKKWKAIEGSFFDNFSEEMFDKLN